MKRSRLETCFDVLEIVRMGNEKPTTIMYKANLSWNTLQQILKVLLHKGLIIETKAGNWKRYKITEKGKKMVGYYNKVLELVIV